ncbi:B [Escherichia phage alpha3]|uniref:Internal scaffolding protein B n=2 Tax=Escherichia phage alpha3 TaxID=10849 RepID=SCAFB_BPAL3|nr:capsid morphogenesis protein [Escherichia phage alpha3]P31278.1 RecName: Full=Internal scaffolding protein B; AltName: Full=Scaffolding protein B; Short=GPB [Escherichia phage alpha3]AAZ38960.1 gpB [Escherichia phage alpha3]CAA42875.1 B [Escherichia phage alpha3] [Escherichia phage alpha3]
MQESINGNLSEERISGTQQSETRNGAPVNGSSEQQGTSGTEPNQLRFQSSVSDSERERQKAIDLEHRRAAFARHFGCAPGSEKHVENYSSFDEKDTRVQLAEFYRFNDGHFKKWGYF